MRGRIEFVTLLVAAGPGRTQVTLPVPRDASAALGSRGRVDVKGTLDGRPLQAAAMPDGKGGHTIQLAREQQDLFGVAAGQRVKVVLEPLAGEAPVEVPPDLGKAIGQNVQARAAWEKFAPSHRRAWVDYVAQSKKSDVRAKRVVEAVQRIALRKQP